jgi:hypothetical protein
MGTVIGNLVMPITARRPKRSVDTVRASVDLFWRGQMLVYGNVTPATAASPVEWLRHSQERARDGGGDTAI